MYIFSKIDDNYPKTNRNLEGLKGDLRKDKDKQNLTYELLTTRNVILVFNGPDLIGVISYKFDKDEVHPPQAQDDFA